MSRRSCSLRTIATILLFFLNANVSAQVQTIIVASTTSTQDSGLFGYLLPIVKARTGVEVKVLAQGTGQALDTARRGDADVVLVHAKSAEEKFLAEGFGVKRYPVMYNDFVIIGPKDDPAGIKGLDVVAALQRIKTKAVPFVSRGDRSGTHIAELALWKDAGVDTTNDRGT
jgi:tungstate transport system substrate-binding protein